MAVSSFWLACRSGSGEQGLNLFPTLGSLERRIVHQGISTLVALVKSRRQERSTRRLLELLLQEGAGLVDDSGKSALEYAVEANAPGFIRVLLDSGLISMLSKNRAFVLAVDLENVPLAREFLVEERADVNSSSPYGLTALHISILRDNCDLIKLCLDHGASTNLRSTSGLTALLLALTRKKSSDVVRLLLSHGADVNLQTLNSRMDAFQIAVYTGSVSNARTVLEFGGDPCRASPNTGYTALHYAARNRDLAMVVYLLGELNAPINLRNKNGLTALDAALSISTEVPKQLFYYMRDRGAEFSAAAYCQHCTYEVMGWGTQIDVPDLLFLLRAAPVKPEEWMRHLNDRVRTEWREWCALTVSDGKARRSGFRRTLLPEELERVVHSFLDEPAWINAAVRATVERV